MMGGMDDDELEQLAELYDLGGATLRTVHVVDEASGIDSWDSEIVLPIGFWDAGQMRQREQRRRGEQHAG